VRTPPAFNLRRHANETSAEFLARRVRLVLWMIVIGNVLFAVTDPYLNPDILSQLLALKLGVVAIQLAAIAALRRPRKRRTMVVIGLVCFAVAVNVSVISGVLTDDPLTTPLLCVAGALITASVIPWGDRAQLVAAIVAVLGVLANSSLIGGFPTTGYPFVGIVTTAGISVYVAYELNWQRRAEARARLALQQHQAELARVLRVGAMDEMAAQLAHELTQPLATIANYATGFKQRLETGSLRMDELPDIVDRIASEAFRAGEIIHRIRRFVRKAEPRRIPVDVNELVRGVVQLVEGEARESRVSVRVACQPDLPRVRADAIQIEQVVINLMRNALEAMRDSMEGSPTVAVETRLDAGNIEVAVRDSGPGLGNGDGSKIFEPFHTTKPNGLGMGLAISRSIIAAHGGRLWVTANPERGVTFHFTMPV